MPLTLNFVTDCGAPTDGTTSCDTAMNTWLTQAIANDGSTLIIPAYNGIGVSSPYHMGTLNGFGNGVKNCTISAQSGASVDALFIGHAGLISQDYTHSSRISTVGTGSTSVTLKTPAEISRFSNGQWIMVSGLGLQTSGYPPNFEYVEFRQITGIVSATISFSTPLQFSYRETWPLVDPTASQSMDLGGPATIYAMTAEFDGTQTWSGLKVTSTGAIFGGAGKSITLTNMDFSAGLGPAPSTGKSWVMQNCQFGTQNEIDKCIEYVEYNNCTGTQILVQSAAPTLLTIKNNSQMSVLNGTAFNTEVQDTSSISSQIVVGAGGYGRSNILTISPTATLGAPSTFAHFIDPSTLSFSNGVFAIANSANTSDFFRLFVPGFIYVYGYSAGNSIVIIDDTKKQTYFRCLDMTQDNTNTYVVTDLRAPPTATYQGNATNAIFAYGVVSLAPSSNPVGAANATVQPTYIPFASIGGIFDLQNQSNMVIRGRTR